MKILSWKMVFVAIGAATASLLFSRGGEERIFDVASPKDVAVSVDGAVFRYADTKAGTIAELLAEAGVDTRDGDRIFPEREAQLFPGMTVFVEREKKAAIKVDGGTKDILTHERSVQGAIEEAGVAIREEDIVKPSRDTVLDRETNIAITRVEIREETVEKKIAFETVEKEDDKLSFRKRIVTQKGESGIRTYRYRVSYHDGKEVGRKLLGNEVTKEPVKEVVTQGTYVKTGKSHRGAASWYAWTGTMAAANPWLPMGSYVKVTNLDNGKSVIVKINDRGPFVPGRIIDLDKVAFQKIASIGAGVINVKMEEIVN